MKKNRQSILAASVLTLLAANDPAAADQIIFHYSEGPAAGTVARLAEQLAPAKPGKNMLGLFFAGRVLKVIPAVDPSAPITESDHWPRILFEAYGEGGQPKSRKPAVFSVSPLCFCTVHPAIDTVGDFARLMSNRHQVLGLDFGGPGHRAAIFAALDPDGSMGLSSGSAPAAASGLKEGALLVFGQQGATGDMHQSLQRMQVNPIDLLPLFGGQPGSEKDSIPLPGELLYEFARSKRYPGYQAAYGKMAKATLQIFYTLSLATPDLTSEPYRNQAKRYSHIGRSTFDALSRALDYHPADTENMSFVNGLRPFMPLEVSDLRRAAVDVLAEGPVVPVPGISHQGKLVTSLLQVISKDPDLAPVARKILIRLIAPERGENPTVTARHEFDRETYRRQAQDHLFGKDELALPAGRALAWTGWGEKKEVEQLIDALVVWAKQGVDDDNVIPILRLAARPEAYTREDRKPSAVVAANEVDRHIANIRTDIEKGFGGGDEHRFIELWDAETE